MLCLRRDLFDAEVLAFEEDAFEEDFRQDLEIASLVFLISNFLILACSWNLWRMKWFVNHTAAVLEAGIFELPWICIVLVEWWR